MDQFQSLITVAPWTFIAQICNLLIQAALIKKFLIKPVRDILQKRQEEVDARYAAADQAQQAADADKAKYQALLADAKQESARITAAAKEEALQKEARILAEAKSEADRMREKAQIDIALDRQKAEAQLQGQVAGLAVDIAEKLMGRELGQNDQDALINACIQGLGDQV